MFWVMVTQEDILRAHMNEGGGNEENNMVHMSKCEEGGGGGGGGGDGRKYTYEHAAEGGYVYTHVNIKEGYARCIPVRTWRRRRIKVKHIQMDMKWEGGGGEMYITYAHTYMNREREGRERYMHANMKVGGGHGQSVHE